MHPISEMAEIEKNVIQMAVGYVRSFFNRDRDLRKQVETLEAQLAEERSGRLSFEKLKSELDCRPDDDHMYWKKDRSGGPYCPTCLHGDEKLVPLINGNRDGSFYCNIHEQYFETKERRERNRQVVSDYSRRRRFIRGRNSWMGS